MQRTMKLFKRNTGNDSQRPLTPRCNHPLAVIVDPTEQELKELETMLARCPNCSQWHPGDGKIYFINLLEMRKITDRVFNRPYDPIDYKVPFKLEKYQIGYFSRIDISG